MEKQAELPKIWCVGVAVCAASYTFDRLFSYIALMILMRLVSYGMVYLLYGI